MGPKRKTPEPAAQVAVEAPVEEPQETTDSEIGFGEAPVDQVSDLEASQSASPNDELSQDELARFMRLASASDMRRIMANMLATHSTLSDTLPDTIPPPQTSHPDLAMDNGQPTSASTRLDQHMAYNRTGPQTQPSLSQLSDITNIAKHLSKKDKQTTITHLPLQCLGPK